MVCFIFLNLQIVVLSAVLLSVANAAPQGKGDAPIAIVSQNSNLEPDGAYQYR